MPKVVKIEPAKALPSLAGSLTCLKVAAYARVSTDQDAQMSSFEAQKDYYEKLIGSHPGWTLVGIYADEEQPYPALFCAYRIPILLRG